MSLNKSMFLTTVSSQEIASGGIETIVGAYKIHTFYDSSALIVYQPIDVSVLLYGAGGTGGSVSGLYGGGGGAGGQVKQFHMSLTNTTYTVTVSGNAAFNMQTALQGGNGGNASGGVAGGGGSNASYNGHAGSGYAGGDGAGAGGNATSYGGNGVGPGVVSNISGSSVEYGKGGAGKSYAKGENGNVGATNARVIIKYRFI